jgi:hypothetical protein
MGGRTRRATGGAWVVAATLFVTISAQAQVVDCNTLVGLVGPLPPNTTCSLSTIHHETDIQGGSPSIVVAGNNPLQVQINQIVSGPNGAAFVNVLSTLGVLGPLGPPTKTFVGTSVIGPNHAVTVGPGQAAIGPDQSLTIFVPANFTNIDENTFFDSVFLISAGSQPLSRRGINWLTGDLYATVQTTLLDDGFHFVDMLLGRGRDGGAQAASTPLGFAAFAPDRPAGPAADALAYMATKAPPSATAYVANGWSAWLAGAGTTAKFDGTANNFGFGYRSGGAAGGMEKRNGSWLYGAAFAVSRANVNQDSTNDSAGIDTQRFGAYAAWQGPLTISAALSYGHHSTDASRLTMLPALGAQGSYQANSLNAGLEVSKTYAWHCSMCSRCWA